MIGVVRELLNHILLASIIALAPFNQTDSGFVDSNVAKDQALAYEKQLDWDHALVAWQSILDRANPPDELRFEAISHVHDLNLKVAPANTTMRAAKPWPALVVIYRNVDMDWKDEKGTVHHFQSHFTDQDIRAIHKAFDTFCGFVFRFSSGIRRVEPTFKIVEQPITSMEGQGSFWLGPSIPKQTLLRLLAGGDYQSVFSYEKFREGDQVLPRAFAGGTYGADQGLNGAGFSEILWDGKYATDGEVELHEWLHEIDWMFTNVLGYPQAASVNPDTGRRVGETGGDPDYKRPPSVINWMDFYRHIMEDHITRTMWREAAMHNPAPNPWLKQRAGHQ